MKKLIRNFLNRRGYEIIKTDNWYTSRKDTKGKILVGKYEITMPGNNTLLKTYRESPDFNSNLGRLAVAMAKKYPAMTILDIGANVGDTISIFKSAIDLPVIGIEGDSTTFKFLQQNTAQFSNVSISNTFLGEKIGEVKADLKHGGANTTIIPMGTGGNTISLDTVDNLLMKDEYKNNIIKLVKLDIEGFDTIALRGSYNMIRKYQPALFFEYNRDVMRGIQEDGLSTLLSFKEYGYNKIGFFDYKGRLLLVTTMKNSDEITHLHNYVIGSNNLLGYLDICIFHGQDDTVAHEFFKMEAKYSGYSS